MFQAQLLMSGTSVYSPWFKRGGDGLRATLEVIAQAGGATLTVQVFTKKEEDTGDGVDANSSVSLTLNAAGRESDEWISTSSTGMNDLVRYKFTLGTATAGWTLFRMLPPVWFDAVKV